MENFKVCSCEAPCAAAGITSLVSFFQIIPLFHHSPDYFETNPNHHSFIPYILHYKSLKQKDLLLI